MPQNKIQSTQIQSIQAAQITGILSTAQGGTGNSDIGISRSNLEAAKSGANSDITSLSGLTTPLSVAQGGTSQNNKTAAFNELSPATTKGDIIANNGTSNIRLAVGIDGQVLMADSASTSGLTWAPGAVGTVTSISSSGGTTGLTLTGGPITSSGTLTLGGTLAIANGGTGLTAVPGSNGQLIFKSSNAYSATSQISYNGSNTISVGASDSTFTIAAAAAATGSATGASILIIGGACGVPIIGGLPGHVYLRGGPGAAGGSGTGGNVYLQSGVGPDGVGSVIVTTGSSQTERLRIVSSGAWGLSGANYGTTGQVLTSNGNGGAPTWTTISAATGTVTSVALSGGTTGLTVKDSPITSSGTITLEGTLVVANGGTGTTTGSITGTEALTFTAGGSNANVNLVPIGTGTVDVSSKRITSLATPTQETDAATKKYVDDVVAGGGFAGGTVPNATIFSSAVTLSSSLAFGTAYTESTSNVTASATTNIDCSLSNNFVITMSSNITSLTFSNVPVSGRLFYLALIIRQDAIGERSLAWPSSIKWPSGVAPVITATANKYDIITIMTYDGGTSWSGFVAGQNY
jgi:hypothetical protein